MLCMPFISSEIKAQCVSSFTFSQNFCAQDSVLFTFTGTGSVTWNFGDSLSGLANTSTLSSVKHQFSDTGFFNVRCVATVGACSDTSFVQLYISQKIQADFSYSDACLGNMANFRNTSTKSYLDTFTQFSWDFGDSTGSVAENPSHSYSSSGNKVVTFIVQSSQGCIDTVVKNINVKPLITYQADMDSACVNSNVKFSVQNNGQNISSYNWSFGDGNTASQSSPDYSYSTAGTKYFSALLTFPDGSTCLMDSDSIVVLPLPNATLSYLSDTIQCFKGNSLCVKFASNTNQVRFRNILWDDGSSDGIPVSDTQFCHAYTNDLGSTYQITHEVIDAFGCAVRIKDSTKIVILKDPKADFDVNVSGGCFTSTLNILNTSNMQPPEVVNFMWNFGDGGLDSIVWSNPTYLYSSDGNFNVSLAIEDTFGCVDTFISNTAIRNISYEVDARLDTIYNRCRLNNRFGFRQTFINQANITWYFGDDDSSSSFNANKRYLSVGDYVPRVLISKLGCDSTLVLDTVTVYGPAARASIQNQFQCEIKDTVYFTNTTIPFKNEHLQTFWTINDPSAPNCTTDTKNGLNVNSNCNNSKDSLLFKHMFTPGTERCFTGYLIQTDTVVGCSDSFFLSVPLMKPNADSGLRVIVQNLACTGPEDPKTVFINLSQTQPSCGRQGYYIMWDSLCAAQSGNFDSYWRFGQDRYNYSYDNLPCDSNGYITMGLILENGQDSLGNVCRDTAFYHNIIKLGVIDPRIESSYNPDSLYCNYTTHEFYFQDSIQDSITNIRWNFGDGTQRTVNTLGKVKHTYTRPGVYLVTSYIEHARGCSGIDSLQVVIGMNSVITTPVTFTCLGDSVRIENSSNYWLDNNLGFFRDSARTANGKERTRWNLGTGIGFTDSGFFTYLNYDQIGNYTVQMEVRDSLGCLDTALLGFRVFDIQSKISLPSDTLICPQVVQLTSSSTVYDSLNNFGHTDDSVAVFIWTFDDGSGSSLEDNPSKFFGSGKQGIKLYTENTRGCKDSIVDSFFIVGPTALFSIVGDSAGCQPHTIEFDNKSVNANAFNWEFNDQFNNVQNTTDTGNISFTYQTYGTFFPRLISRMNMLNNGIPISCADTFPLTINGDSAIPVVVFEKPTVRFAHSTDCSNNTTSFFNTTVVNTDTILSVLWFFGDGDSSTSTNPVHQYADTGAYRVVLYVTVGKGCQDSLVRTIYISPTPSANFTFSNVCLNESMNFVDQSQAFNDVIFRWNWSYGDGNSAFTPNPSHTYTLDSSYMVRLIVTNRAGCVDTVQKQVTVHSIPVIDFSFNNVCEEQTHLFNGQGSVKNSTLSYQWDFGNGGNSTLEDPQYTYSDTGNYNVTLVATSGFGCKDSVSKSVRLHPKPAPGFNINQGVQCLKDNDFIFTNTSLAFGDSIVLNLWSTSAGGTSNLQNYRSTFGVFDSVLVTLINETDEGCRDTLSKWIEVLESPNINLASTSLGVCINGDTLELQDSGKNAESVNQRSWNLNQSLLSNDSNFFYKFNTIGQNQLLYWKELTNGCRDSANLNIDVYHKPNVRLLVDNAEQCFSNHTFQFTDSSDIATGQSLTSQWNLGNGDSRTLNQFSYTYSNADTFLVKLISSSPNGCVDSGSTTVIVHPEPVPDFDIDTLALCLRDNLFSFTNRSSIIGTSMTYLWRFTPSDSTTAENPTFQFNTFGSKTVQLNATSLFGCKDSVSKGVIVHPMPIAVPSLNDENQCFNDQNFVYTDSSFIANGSLSRTWLWANGDRDTQIQVQRFYSKDTALTHRLVSTSGFGCADTTEIENVVLPVPESIFTVNDSAQCQNLQDFQFTNVSFAKDGPLQSFWSFGDGARDTVNDAQHFYSNSGAYGVQLIVLSIQSCLDTFSKSIYVQEVPNASLSVNDSAQCFNSHQFDFVGNSNISVGSVVYFEWDTLNNPFVGSKDTTLFFPIPGSYEVRYVVGSEDQCNDTAFQTITVHPNAQAEFDINDSLQCENDNLFEFNSLSSIAYGSFVDSWYRDFNYFASNKNPTLQFNSQDTFDINLINTSDKGCRDTQSIPIFVVPAPATRFAINDSGQCLLANRFDFSNTSSIEVGALTSAWDFGDGNNSPLKDPSHVYGNHGDYRVQLISTSIYNCKDTSSVLALVHPEPTASFTVNDASQCFTNHLFELDNGSTIDSTEIFYEWSFGDGNSSNLQSPTHSYSSYGTYTTKLVVNSNYGCLDSTEEILVVNPMPQTNFTINDREQCINEQDFSFDNTSQIVLGDIASFEWRTQGQQFSNVNPLQPVYLSSGPFTVELKTTSDSGCVDSITQNVRVYPKPISRIVVNDSVQCLRGNNYIYSENSFDSFGLQSFTWYQEGQVVSVIDSFEKRYLSSGLKYVDLVSTSINGCRDTTQIEVRVKPMPNPVFNALKSYYCEDEPSSLLVPEQQGGAFFGKNVSGQLYTPRILWRDTVKYVITQEGCSDSSSQFTDVWPLPNASLGNDTTICKHESLYIGPISWNSNFQWNTGSTDSAIRITRPGRYTVIATNICGRDTSSFNLSIKDINCRFFLPTAFTPNSNNINDNYKPVTFNVDEMTYEIFNRWGEKIYEGTLADNGWDGTYGGKEAPSGYYVVVVKYSYQTDFRLIQESASETFYLLR